MGYLSGINENFPIREKKKRTIHGIMKTDRRVNSCLYVNRKINKSIIYVSGENTGSRQRDHESYPLMKLWNDDMKFMKLKFTDKMYSVLHCCGRQKIP
jgi:hypothetical protein